MKTALMIIVSVAFLVSAIVYSAKQNRECKALGGVLVKGQVAYVCLATAEVKP